MGKARTKNPGGIQRRTKIGFARRQEKQGYRVNNEGGLAGGKWNEVTEGDRKKDHGSK